MGDRAEEQTTDLPRAAALMVASALLFAGMSVAVKLLALTLSNATVVFFRNLMGLVALLPFLVRLGRGGLATRHLKQHLVRGLAGLAAMYCFFFAIARLRLADAVLLNYSLPLFVPFIETAWLGEPLPRGLWRGILIGFAGLLLILKPGLGLFQPAALVGLAAAVLAALAQVGVRRLTRTEPATRIVFYFGLVSSVVSAGPAALDWSSPGRALWPTLGLLGLTATLAQLFMTRAYACAPAAQVGPFIYTSVVFAGVFDWLLFAKLPDAISLVGALLVGFAGALTLRLAEARRAPAPAGL